MPVLNKDFQSRKPKYGVIIGRIEEADLFESRYGPAVRLRVLGRYLPDRDRSSSEIDTRLWLNLTSQRNLFLLGSLIAAALMGKPENSVEWFYDENAEFIHAVARLKGCTALFFVTRGRREDSFVVHGALLYNRDDASVGMARWFLNLPAAFDRPVPKVSDEDLLGPRGASAQKPQGETESGPPDFI